MDCLNYINIFNNTIFIKLRSIKYSLKFIISKQFKKDIDKYNDYECNPNDQLSPQKVKIKRRSSKIIYNIVELVFIYFHYC